MAFEKEILSRCILLRRCICPGCERLPYGLLVCRHGVFTRGHIVGKIVNIYSVFQLAWRHHIVMLHNLTTAVPSALLPLEWFVTRVNERKIGVGQVARFSAAVRWTAVYSVHENLPNALEMGHIFRP